MNELELIEKKELREKYINRIEVLEKVKGLLLLPDIMMATTQQVANFYEVDVDTIKWHIRNNKDELKSDGFIVWKSGDFRNESNSLLKINNRQGGFVVTFSDGTNINSSNKGTSLFTRRAILRIGMLLRDSKIAKEVRTQLLNIEEKTTNEQKIASITEEQQLMLNVMYAKNDSDRLLAFSKFNDYKNRYINKLENKIEVLVNGILTWNAREGVNRMARQIANKTFGGSYPKAWDKISAEMLYKHNIGVTARKNNSKLKKPTIFDVITEEEMPLLVKSCISLCDMYKINVDELFVEFK